MIDWEVTIRAGRRDFVVSTDIVRARGLPRDGRAVFSHPEVILLKTAMGKRTLPARLASLLHAVKSIMGGEVIHVMLLDKT
jgi:hypothetical protein